MKPTIIYGPPGTGKTTECLNIVQGLLADDIQPESIAFIAFTRKAANEARDRAIERFQLPIDRFPLFRTLHSLAFQSLGFGRNNIMGIADYLKICEALGLSMTFKTVGEDGTFSGQTRGDRLLFTENMARATLTPLREFWEKFPNEDLYWYELERLQKTLENYKKKFGKHDFTDIITGFCDSDFKLGIHTLIIDEAQDLTPLQWKMATKLMAEAQEIYIAGDDDQAIFRWAGADVDKLIHYDGERRVLQRSYRVPRAVQDVAMEICSRIEDRVPKVWEPRDAPGEVNHVTSIEQIDMSQGTWLLLGRNMYLLDPLVDHCLREGFVFDSVTGSPVKGSSFRAIKHWEELRRGEHIRMSEVVNIYDHMSTKVGVAHGFKKRVEAADERLMMSMEILKKDWGLTVDTIWHQALDKLTPVEVEYFIAALKRGEKLLKTPRIKISTIHGVKGGEADNVVVLTDMAERTYNEYQQNPDDEHRVWYVAVTRAREKLFIVQPQSTRNYKI